MQFRERTSTSSALGFRLEGLVVTLARTLALTLALTTTLLNPNRYDVITVPASNPGGPIFLENGTMMMPFQTWSKP